MFATLSGTPPALLFFYLFLGSVTGSLAYILTARIIRIDSSILKPLNFLSYLALFAAIKMCVERLGNSFWIVVGAWIAMWIVAVAIKESKASLSDRILYFGSVIIIAAVLVGFGSMLLPIMWGVMNFQPRINEMPLAIAIYGSCSVTSIFAAPILEHVFHIAMSMRPKPD